MFSTRIFKGGVVQLIRTYRTSAVICQQYGRSPRKLSYYDVLGIHPKSTQAQIKTAFYNLSKLHHPDINQGEDIDGRFAEITEAYNILGNFTLRKRYDKGILGPRDFRGDFTPESEKSPMEKKSGVYTGQMYNARGEKVYDFDEFYRSTYGEQLAREQRLRKLKQHVKQNIKITTSRENQYYVGEIGMMIAFVGFAYLVYSLTGVGQTEKLFPQTNKPQEEERR